MKIPEFGKIEIISVAKVYENHVYFLSRNNLFMSMGQSGMRMFASHKAECECPLDQERRRVADDNLHT